jgi:peroxiredoxin
VQLQGQVERLRAQGLGLAAISYDSPEILAAFSQRYGITFPLLSDAGSRTIAAYGILNTVADEALAGDADDQSLLSDVKKYISATGVRNVAVITKGTPFPGTFLLDRDGRVAARDFETFYRERTTASTILLRLGTAAAPVTATKITRDDVEITTYPTDSTVAPGYRTAIVVRVSPRPRMHIYAPGASGYRPVKLEIAADPLVRVLPLQYPPSQMYLFEPLNERVPVYQTPFTLAQEIVLEVTPEAERAFRGKSELTVTGTLEYQACDDKVCFNPVAVPLSWTLKVTPNITERIKKQ